MATNNIKLEVKTEAEISGPNSQLNEDDNTPLRNDTCATPERPQQQQQHHLSATGWGSDEEEASISIARNARKLHVPKPEPKESPPSSPTSGQPPDGYFAEFHVPRSPEPASPKLENENTPERRPFGDLDNILSSIDDMPFTDAIPKTEQMDEAEDSIDENEIRLQLEKTKQLLAALEQQETEPTPKKRKKQKKDKSHRDKKRRRSRSPSGSPPRKRSHKSHKRSKENGLPRVTVKTEPETPPDLDMNLSNVRPDERRFIRLVDPSRLMAAPEPSTVPSTQPLSIRDKRKLAVERARAALLQFELKASKALNSEFLMVDTIYKLPSSSSYMSQGIFENPSPICNNFNVMYKFNSMPGTSVQVAKWGLEAMPEVTTELLNLLAVDVLHLKQMQSNTITSQRILKLRQEAKANGQEEIKMETATSLYTNVSTQTENRSWTQDKGVQTTPIEESKKPGGAFWEDPSFNPTDLTQQQANVMYALQELMTTLPGTNWADLMFMSLQKALNIKRTAQRHYQPTNY